MAGFPLGIDFAAVELSALLLVPENLVRRIHLGKPRLCLGVIFVLIGMMFLGEAAECLLDLTGARRLGDAQDLIGIAHLYLCPQAQTYPPGSGADTHVLKRYVVRPGRCASGARSFSRARRANCSAAPAPSDAMAGPPTAD